MSGPRQSHEIQATRMNELKQLLPDGTSALEKCMLMLIERLGEAESKIARQADEIQQIANEIRTAEAHTVLCRVIVIGRTKFYHSTTRATANIIRDNMSAGSGMIFEEKTPVLAVSSSAEDLERYTNPVEFRERFSTVFPDISFDDIDPSFVRAPDKQITGITPKAV